MDKCGLTNFQKVETVIQYVDRSQCHIWQSLPGYINRDWDNFCDDLGEEYVNPSAKGQCSRQKLAELTNRYARKRMDDETDIIHYYRKFHTLAKTLIDSGRITKHEYNVTFWHGFHPEDQKFLLVHLIAKHLNQPRGQAFDYKDILDTARAVFSGDNDFLLQEPPSRHYQSDCVRDQRMERSSRDQREYNHNKRAYRRGHAHNPPPSDCQVSDDEEALSSDEEPCPSQGRRHLPHVEMKIVRFQDSCHKTKDLEDLVGRLHGLSVRDREYVNLHARRVDPFPNAMMGIPKPGYRDGPPMVAYLYQATASLPPTPQPWSAPTTAPAPVPITPPASTGAPTSFFQPRPDFCTFCCAQGHRVHSCPIANEYLTSRHASVIEE